MELGDSKFNSNENFSSKSHSHIEDLRKNILYIGNDSNTFELLRSLNNTQVNKVDNSKTWNKGYEYDLSKKYLLVVIDIDFDSLDKIKIYQKIRLEDNGAKILFFAESDIYDMVRCTLSPQPKDTLLFQKPANQEELLNRIRMGISFAIDRMPNNLHASSGLLSDTMTRDSLDIDKNDQPNYSFTTNHNRTFRYNNKVNSTNYRLQNNSTQDKAAELESEIESTNDDHIQSIETIQMVKSLINLSTDHIRSKELGIVVPIRGILLYGKHFQDKLDTVEKITEELDAKLIYIDIKELLTQKTYGEPEEILRNTFKNAKTLSRPVIHLDNLDSLTINQPYDSLHISRTASQLLALLDRIDANDNIIVIGSAVNQNSINPQFRLPGRFDTDFFIKPPSKQERFEALQKITESMKLSDDIDLLDVADMTDGMAKTDLQNLIRIASLSALKNQWKKGFKRNIEFNNVSQEFENGICSSSEELSRDKIILTMNDIKISLNSFKDYTAKGIHSPHTTSRWEQLGGMDKIIQEIREELEWPQKFPVLYRSMKIRPPKGILLHGPPGTGKTSIARAIAASSKSKFISIKGPELISKWIGDSEKAIRETFKKAKENSPSIIFFDEIDAITPQRSSDIDKSEVINRVISQMLTEMDGLEGLDGVTVIATTNRIDIIDKALLRPGRFDKIIHIPPPDKESRHEILKILTADSNRGSDVDLYSIANITNNFTGADLTGLIIEAKKIALKEHIMNQMDMPQDNLKQNHITIHQKHILAAREKINLQNNVGGSEFKLYR